MPQPLARLTIVDFGSSVQTGCKQDRMTCLVGTVDYAAPEVGLRSTPVSSSGYNYKCDMWSIGVILHMMLSARSPFYTDRPSTEKWTNILEFSDSKWKSISDEVKDLICRLLEPTPLSRYDCLSCLKHVWIKQFEVQLQQLYKTHLKSKAIDKKPHKIYSHKVI